MRWIFCRDAAALARPGELLDWTGQGSGYLDAALERFLRRPTPEEGRVLGALPARDSFGGDTPTRPLALVPTPWERLLHPSRLREAFQHAFWKRGVPRPAHPARNDPRPSRRMTTQSEPVAIRLERVSKIYRVGEPTMAAAGRAVVGTLLGRKARKLAPK